jgi:hypothetical protein
VAGAGIRPRERSRDPLASPPTGDATLVLRPSHPGRAAEPPSRRPSVAGPSSSRARRGARVPTNRRGRRPVRWRPSSR